jgi:hypothetical protein
MFWIRQNEVPHQAWQRVPKLHGVQRGDRDGLIVEAGERIVDNSSGTPFMLWDDTHWTDTQAGQMLDVLVWEDNPLRLVHHVGELVTQEIEMIVGGAMRAQSHGGSDAALRPWHGLENNRSAPMFILSEQASRRMA